MQQNAAPAGGEMVLALGGAARRARPCSWRISDDGGDAAIAAPRPAPVMLGPPLKPVAGPADPASSSKTDEQRSMPGARGRSDPGLG